MWDVFRRTVRMEIPLFLYMLTSFLKYPVFQNLLYEKSCLERYNQNISKCSNVTAYYNDKLIQADANHFYLLSSIVLILPSVFSTLLLGAATDLWSMKIPLLIPFVGLILCTLNYVVQTAFMGASIYLLLISDVIFGLGGGYIAILGETIFSGCENSVGIRNDYAINVQTEFQPLILSYGVKTTSVTRRSIRIAGAESAIGLGGTVGYILSGTTREAIGYSYMFLLMLILQVFAFFYILLFAKEYERAELDHRNNESSVGVSMLFWKCVEALSDYWRLLTIDRRFRLILALNLIAFGVELFIFAGLMDIQYSYFRFILGWGDRQYGWFSGLQFAVTTIAISVLYPLLYVRGFTDATLGCFGLLAKMFSLVLLAFLTNSAMAYSLIIFTCLNRFVATGFRSFISSIIETSEQGKMFSLIALLEGVIGLFASALFNSLYPKTLSFFPGLLYIASCLLLIVPFLILWNSGRVVKSERLAEL
ncbi:hypothetical protein KIN20_003719 [Parelaphostrongylus tenuis]|uniref:Uncharacterized protein n=1 Tax=Parelaphostrongylus tenuis TaxID=148309 RepID=A0AAD5M1Z6_PARTN|nr:hypothetical protein KIN20_003719 [Parelaphostrongylus tenuis]